MLYLEYLGIGGVFMGLSKLTTTLLALDSLSIYRALLKDKVLFKLKALLIYLDHGDVALRKLVNLYNDFYFELAKSETISLNDYIIDQIVFDENPFSFKIQAVQCSDSDSVLEKAVSNDLRGLQLVSKLDPSMIKAEITELFEDNSAKQIIEGLLLRNP
jgi:hypothetical protein